MAFLNYEYNMKIRYSEPVDKCYFTIKGVSADDVRQRNISYNITLRPETQYSEGRDSFGNIQLVGSEKVLHSEFEYTINGLVETQPLSISGGINSSTIGMYKYPHGKCVPGESILQFYEELRNIVEKCDTQKQKSITIMEHLYEKMCYEKGSTIIETTAEEAFCKGKGVCQDYAHIFICLLRLFSIPARYVCGVIIGEGKSHAWVEAACDGQFIGLDPTHNIEITDEYIKFNVGRDASDCSINRGVMWGGGQQEQIVNVKVEKLY